MNVGVFNGRTSEVLVVSSGTKDSYDEINVSFFLFSCNI